MWQSWGKTLLSKGPRQTQPREAVRTEERNTTEFRGGKAKYNPHSQQCHRCCLCHTPRAEGRWAAKTNKSLENLLGWWGGTPGSFCLQTEFQHPLTDDRKMSHQKRNHRARKWTREKDENTLIYPALLVLQGSVYQDKLRRGFLEAGAHRGCREMHRRQCANSTRISSTENAPRVRHIYG